VLRPIDINIPRPRPVRPAPPTGGHQKRHDFEFEDDMEEVYEDALEGEMESQLQAYSQGVQFHPAQPCYGLAPVCDPTSDEFRADGVSSRQPRNRFTSQNTVQASFPTCIKCCNDAPAERQRSKELVVIEGKAKEPVPVAVVGGKGKWRDSFNIGMRVGGRGRSRGRV